MGFQRLPTRDTVTTYREYNRILQNIVDAEMIKESGGDADLEKCKQELKMPKIEKERIREEKLKIASLPKDPNDDKNSILEIH